MVELLAPAGDMACFEAAMSAGADAVYVGGDRFGARAYAHNFSREELLHVLRKAHLFNKKVYLTINTLMKEQELSELIPFLLPYYEEGLDGVIIQDLGALTLVREVFPKLPIHASTQMTVTGQYGASFLKDSGVSRVVPARELSLSEITCIKAATGLEQETFIHGAMCYSYSGQCLFSSMLGPRSGNRGRCAGPCRLPYQTCLNGKVLNSRQEMYQLSLKDLCVLEILPKLIDSGIDSFKIEGRMKSPQYVSFVTGIYRKYIDFYREHPENYYVSNADMIQLKNKFSRGSIQSGYYFMHNGPQLLTLTKPGYQSFAPTDSLKEADVLQPALETEAINLTGHFTAALGKPISLTVHVAVKDLTLTVMGAPAQRAVNAAATCEAVEKQLKKTGNTPFVFSQITFAMESCLFLPNKELNALRREALTLIEERLLQPFRRSLDRQHIHTQTYTHKTGRQPVPDTCPEMPVRRNPSMKFYVGINTVSQLLALQENPLMREVEKILLSFDCLEEIRGITAKQQVPVYKSLQTLKKNKINVYLRLPAIVRQKTIHLLEEYQDTIADMDFTGFCVSNLEAAAYIRLHYKDKPCMTDSGFHIFNTHACDVCDKLSIYEHVLSFELHKKEIHAILTNNKTREHNFILPVYGYIPLMESAGCVLKTNGQCRKERDISTGLHEEVALLDRQNKKLHVTLHCSRCENTIYNAVPLCLLKETADICSLPLKGVLLNFTTENSQTMNELLSCFQEAFHNKVWLRQAELPLQEFTKGHFLKGVE